MTLTVVKARAGRARENRARSHETAHLHLRRRADPRGLTALHETDPPAAYPYEGPQALRRPIEAALRQVVDPEVAMTIVDVGLVYGVAVSDDRVHVRMTMTSAACPVAELLLGEVEAELERVLPPRMKIHVELVWEPAWTTDRMSPQAKAFMGW